MTRGVRRRETEREAAERAGTEGGRSGCREVRFLSFLFVYCASADVLSHAVRLSPLTTAASLVHPPLTDLFLLHSSLSTPFPHLQNLGPLLRISSPLPLPRFHFSPLTLPTPQTGSLRLPAESLLSDSKIDEIHDYLRERGLFAFLKRYLDGYHDAAGDGGATNEATERMSVEVVLMAFGVRLVR